MGYPISQWSTLGIKVDGTPLPADMLCTEENSEAFGAVSAAFFCSFVLFCTLIVFNLFIGVIITNIDKAKEEMMEEILSIADIIEERKQFQTGDSAKNASQKLEDAQKRNTKIHVDNLVGALDAVDAIFDK